MSFIAHWAKQLSLWFLILTLLLQEVNVKKLTLPKAHPHMFMSVPEIIESRGYPAETHKAITKDGYILTLHRIPGPRFSNRSINNQMNPNQDNRETKNLKKVALLQHCTFCSSYNFILNDPDQALGFLMADHGYDVWLGNFRGNNISNEHISLSVDQLDFWKFTLDHLFAYDLPATIDYILSVTQKKKLYYVGHSVGAMSLFALMNLMPEYNDKIFTIAALAPVTNLANVRGPFKILWIYTKAIYESNERKGILSLGQDYKPRHINTICDKTSPSLILCKLYLPYHNGFNIGYIDDDYLKVVLTHFPFTTSARSQAHFGQIMQSGKFQQFDYGPRNNSKIYGSKQPPQYSLKSVKVPVAVFWSENDYVSSPEEAANIMRDLPNVTLNYKVPLADFNHMDYAFAENAAELVYKPLLEYLAQY